MLGVTSLTWACDEKPEARVVNLVAGHILLLKQIHRLHYWRDVMNF